VAIPQSAGWQSIFTTGLLRRPATCGTPRPAKSGNILAVWILFQRSPFCGICGIEENFKEPQKSWLEKLWK